MNMELHIHANSHLDHLNFLAPEVKEGLLDFLKSQWPAFYQFSSNRVGPWTHTFSDIGIDMPCDLIGPMTGLPPVAESEVSYRVRPGRKCATRFVSGTPVRTPSLTIVVGPYAGLPCVLYTVYPGPCAPREPGDLSIATWDEIVYSRQFWSEHALVG